MPALTQDLRYALRNLARSPLFTLVALLSLALGIGANSAVFTLADQVLLRPLPVQHARDLVHFTSPGPQSGMVWGANTFSYPMFQDFRDHNSVFAGVAARFGAALGFAWNNHSEQINAEIVSGTWFDTLGLQTVLGRGLTPDDDRLPGAHPVVVLTYDFWQSHFGGKPSVLNQTVLLNGHPMTIVGVAAPGYRGFDVGARVDALVPAMMKAQMTPTWNGLDNRRVLWLQLIGRLKPGVAARQAQASLQPYYRSLLEMELQAMPARPPRIRQRFLDKPLIFEPAERGLSGLREAFSQPLLILLGIVGLLLLIACANVANLLLARAAAREREIAVRLALGAGRLRLVRQLVVESLVLSVAGGALGLLVAAWTGRSLLGLLANAPDLSLTARPDLRVFAFTFALALVTGMIFGLVPALKATSPSLAGTLKDQAGSVSAGSGHVRLRKALVISQVALSLLLLISAVLFARSLHNLRDVDLGFRRESLMAFSMDPSLNGYSPERIHQFAAALQQRLAAVPGVRSAAVGVNPVLGDNQDMSTISVVGYQAKDDEDMNPWFDSVSPGYFSTLGIPLLLGRDFTPRDGSQAPKVAIVNDVFVRYFFKDRDPIGQRFSRRSRKESIEIVGVVRSSRYSRVDEKTPRVVYLPFAQDPNPSSLVAYARASADPKSLFGAIRREAAALDSSLPIVGMRTMDEQVDEALSAPRLVATLSAFFGVLATLLAAIGLYGVMAYTVTRRTREIGIRLALGAGRRSLLGMVMREVALLTLAGVVIAIPFALALARLVRAQLYGIVPTDPLSIAAAAAALIAVALAAGYVPAERATRVNPVSALRYE